MPYLGRAPTGTGSVTEIDGDLKITGQLTSNDTLFKMTLDGTDGSSTNAGDNFLIEDGGTDGSGTDAGDDICIEKDTEGVSDISSIASGVAGGFQLIQTNTLAGVASIDFALDNTVFKDYMFTWSNMQSSQDNVSFGLLISIDGGSSFITSGTYKINSIGVLTTSSTTRNDTGSAFFRFNSATTSNAANEKTTGTCMIYNPAAADYTTVTYSCNYIDLNSAKWQLSGAGYQTGKSAVDALQFKFNGGNATGECALYGLPRT